MSIQTEINRIKAAVSAIKTAVEEKGVTVPESAAISDLAALIESIQTGTDTSDATATADDIATGKTAYINGEKVTGDIPVYASFSQPATSAGTNANNNLLLSYVSTIRRLILDKNPRISLTAPLTNFGDADAGDVLSGKTFTSQAGLKVSGAYTPLDTSDATATAGNIELNKTAYVNGEKITGALARISGKVVDGDPSSTSDNIYITGSNNEHGILPGGAVVGARAHSSNFGDATAADVVEGKTFTSVAGLKVAGTYIPLDTSDADATANDIAKGKTAYVNGEKITGDISSYSAYNTTLKSFEQSGSDAKITLERAVDPRIIIGKGSTTSMTIPLTTFGDVSAEEVEEGKTFTSQEGLKVTGTLKKTTGIIAGSIDVAFNEYANPIYNDIRMTVINSEKRILMENADITVYARVTTFGDATAADVAKGKTFTSSAGLKVTGTAESGNDNCEAYHITSASDVINFKGSGTVKVWGYGIRSSGYTNTLYAFVGDGYYSGSMYGSPSKTSASFSIGSDGTLQGLPSGLSGVDLLVTINV